MPERARVKRSFQKSGGEKPPLTAFPQGNLTSRAIAGSPARPPSTRPPVLSRPVQLRSCAREHSGRNPVALNHLETPPGFCFPFDDQQPKAMAPQVFANRFSSARGLGELREPRQAPAEPAPILFFVIGRPELQNEEPRPGAADRGDEKALNALGSHDPPAQWADRQEEMVRIFKAAGVHRESIAAAILFRDAAAQGEITANLLEGLRAPNKTGPTGRESIAQG